MAVSAPLRYHDFADRTVRTRLTVENAGRLRKSLFDGSCGRMLSFTLHPPLADSHWDCLRALFQSCAQGIRDHCNDGSDEPCRVTSSEKVGSQHGKGKAPEVSSGVSVMFRIESPTAAQRVTALRTGRVQMEWRVRQRRSCFIEGLDENVIRLGPIRIAGNG